MVISLNRTSKGWRSGGRNYRNFSVTSIGSLPPAKNKFGGVKNKRSAVFRSSPQL
jgi:hypothetical protein